MAVTFTLRAGATAAPLFPALVDLYALVYAEPPYGEGPEQVAGFADGLPGEAARPGFTLVAADDAGTLVGAAYGWTMPAGRWWTRADREPPAELLNVDKFAVMEWIVHSGRRGEGIGSELMRRLLDGRPEPYATLASNPLAAARRVYERAGWQQVAGSHMPDGTPMDLLILTLPATPVQRR
ncbi:GNAT family N-acetyltransferase [Micromonospora sp. NPDC050695]|uniref:GNAT family N-acetyltransferase n=1 Tax=Micromonospora sp. NPDC050695 TaxID=3154938 RepID=UPI0033C1B8C8